MDVFMYTLYVYNIIQISVIIRNTSNFFVVIRKEVQVYDNLKRLICLREDRLEFRLSCSSANVGKFRAFLSCSIGYWLPAGVKCR